MRVTLFQFDAGWLLSSFSFSLHIFHCDWGKTTPTPTLAHARYARYVYNNFGCFCFSIKFDLISHMRVVAYLHFVTHFFTSLLFPYLSAHTSVPNEVWKTIERNEHHCLLRWPRFEGGSETTAWSLRTCSPPPSEDCGRASETASWAEALSRYFLSSGYTGNNWRINSLIIAFKL